MRQQRNYQSPCKRTKCPYYGTYYTKCQTCDWNRNSVWTETKKGK